MRSWRVLRSEAASFGPRPRAFSGASQAPSWLAASARHELFARLHQLRKGKRKSEEVLLVIHECRRWNLIRDPRDWVVAMGALSRAQLWEETIGMLEDMHKDGGIAIHALNASVSAAGRATHWQTALALFGQAKRYAVLPDAVTSNAVLTACDKGGQWQRALNIFDDMKSSHSLEPNVITYSAVMSACEHGHAWQEALQVFRSMQDNNTAVDVVAVNAALSACDRGCRWQEALAMLANMGEGSLKASLTSFGSTISACGNALYWEAAIDLLRLLDEKQLKPGLIVWNLCINACRKARKLHAALALFKELPARSEQPDMLSFTSIASACASSAEWQLAVSFLEDATSCNQTPDTAFYNAILGVCREASQWEEAYRIMHELQEQGLAPTMSTFKAVIAACAYSMRWSDALDHLQALQRSQLVGTPREQEDLILQYGIVSKACQEAGLRHVAQRLLEEAEQSVPSDGLVSSLPAEWLSVLHWQAALSFFERKQAPKENAGVEVVGLADVLLEAGRDADAMSLLLEAQEERILRLWKGRKLDLHYLGLGLSSLGNFDESEPRSRLLLGCCGRSCSQCDPFAACTPPPVLRETRPGHCCRARS